MVGISSVMLSLYMSVVFGVQGVFFGKYVLAVLNNEVQHF